MTMTPDVAAPSLRPQIYNFFADVPKNSIILFFTSLQKNNMEFFTNIKGVLSNYSIFTDTSIEKK